MFSLKMDYTNYVIWSTEGNVFLYTRSLVDIRGETKKLKFAEDYGTWCRGWELLV